jgi:LysM repeat protein
MNTMQITHEEAQNLIQLDLDRGLTFQQKNILDAHLLSCANCQKYAKGLRDMESILRPLLQRQWTRQPIPLPINILASKSKAVPLDRKFLATRIAAVTVMFVVFMFSAWQFSTSRPSGWEPAAANKVPPVPTPVTSAQVVITRTQTQACEETSYVVAKNDTLPAIALRFAVSEEEIRQANGMTSDAVRMGSRLIVPICSFTPTLNPLTTTYTPFLQTITSTPGG